MLDFIANYFLFFVYFFLIRNFYKSMSAEEQQLISKKRKFVADGVFKAEIHQFFSRALVGAGYSGLTVKQTNKKL